jgi:hypothetical protein
MKVPACGAVATPRPVEEVNFLMKLPAQDEQAWSLLILPMVTHNRMHLQLLS